MRRRAWIYAAAGARWLGVAAARKAASTSPSARRGECALRSRAPPQRRGSSTADTTPRFQLGNVEATCRNKDALAVCRSVPLSTSVTRLAQAAEMPGGRWRWRERRRRGLAIDIRTHRTPGGRRATAAPSSIAAARVNRHFGRAPDRAGLLETRLASLLASAPVRVPLALTSRARRARRRAASSASTRRSGVELYLKPHGALPMLKRSPLTCDRFRGMTPSTKDGAMERRRPGIARVHARSAA